MAIGALLRLLKPETLIQIPKMSWTRLQEPYRLWVEEAQEDNSSYPPEPFMFRMWSSSACEAPGPRRHAYYLDILKFATEMD